MLLPALVKGELPIFLEIKGYQEIFFNKFRSGQKGRVELGAEQVR